MTRKKSNRSPLLALIPATLYSALLCASDGSGTSDRPAAIAFLLPPESLDQSAADQKRPAATSDSADDPSAAPDESESDETEEESGQLQRYLNTTAFGCWLSKNNLTVGGYLEQGFTWNPDSPRDRFNGPVAPNDRANEYQLNQLNLFIQREVDKKPGCWDLGGRIGMLYGTDHRFNTALGLEDKINGGNRFYGLAIPQIFAEIFAPVGSGLTITAGHFLTLIGYEYTDPTENFFYSQTYTSFTEPATHTGVLAAYQLTKQLSVEGGFTRGWDNWNDNNDDLAYTQIIEWKSADERTTVSYAMHVGDEQAPDLDRTRYIQMILVSRLLTKKLKFTLHSDIGFEDDGATDNRGRVYDSEWFGLTQYLQYEINERCEAGIRFEWFRDDDGARLIPVESEVGPGAGTYFDFTVGLNWRPRPNVRVRPEVRWDRSAGGIRPFDNATDANQFLFAFDVIWEF